MDIRPIANAYLAQTDPPVEREVKEDKGTVPRREITVRKQAAGLLQAPFGYFNPGLGVMHSLSLADYNFSVNHPAYEAAKAQYLPGNVTENRPNFTGAYQNWSVFLDLGQFRLGHDFSASTETTLISETYMESSMSPTDTIKDLKVGITKQNYAWAGLSLLSFGGKDNPVFFTLWLDYALDRYSFGLKDSKYYHSQVYPPTTELASQNAAGSGGGWGHNISADVMLTSSNGQPGKWEYAWSLSFKTGYNFGQLSDDGNVWHSRFSGWTAGLSLGLQFNHTGSQTKMVECRPTYRSSFAHPSCEIEEE